jgi:hypothetical protein
VSKKSQKIAERIRGFSKEGLDPHYLGYFDCFNRAEYYEAHDVLEELWLAEGRNGPNYPYYKGLIQAAGAFVHLQKHHHHPDHKTHGQRLNPAARLFRLALHNLSPYPSPHLSFQVKILRGICRDHLAALEEGNYSSNPWRPQDLPRLPTP